MSARRSLTIPRLASLLQDFSPQILGDAGVQLDGVATLPAARASDLAFLSNSKYRAQAQETRAGCLLLAASEAALLAPPQHGCRLVCTNPYAAFAVAAQWFAAGPPIEPGVHISAVVSDQASIAASAVVGPQAVIGAGAVIGDGVQIGAGCFIGAGAKIGAQTILHAGAVFYHGCEIGQRCIVHSGAVIGADGFGFAPHKGRWIKIPQTGRVLIGEDCEIGANTTIDRGAMGDTQLGNGVKLDNQIQIGHNTIVGDDCAFAGCVGVAGSAVIGKRVQLGGAAMILGHLSICDDAVISTGSAVISSITKPGFYTGIFPLDENAKWEKNAVLIRRLDKMRDEMKSLRRELDALKKPA